MGCFEMVGMGMGWWVGLIRIYNLLTTVSLKAKLCHITYNISVPREVNK